MKSSLKTLPLLVTCALAASGVAAASAYPTAAAPSAAVLHTTAKLSFAHQVDLGKHGPSAGDITTFGGRLVGPDLKGSYQASCINVTATTQECTESLTVPGGHLAAQASYGQASTALTPIVGGSGSYVGARGDMSEREINNGREVQLVLHLNP
jgi:hypothetical protein